MVCPHAPWHCAVQQAGCSSPRTAADFSSNAASDPVLRHCVWISSKLKSFRASFALFDASPPPSVLPPVPGGAAGKGAGGMLRAHGQPGHGCLEPACLFLQSFPGDLPGPEGCRERSVVVAWQKPQSALLTRDGTARLVFPKQKAAVTHGE